MGFPGTWMTESESVVYRVVPKCACSTIGQVMYYGDHGTYFDGDIHDATSGIHKWGIEESKPLITKRVTDQKTYAFTCVRNPYSRVLSAYFDKIAGIQRNGKRYRGNLVPMLVRKYGVDVEGDFDQIASFRRFLLFVRDTIKFRKPMDPDIHWSAMSGHISTFIAMADASTGLSRPKISPPVWARCCPRLNRNTPSIWMPCPALTRAKVTAPNAPFRWRITSTTYPNT